MERCWKRIQVPRWFTIWMMLILMISIVEISYGSFLIYTTYDILPRDKKWFLLGIGLLITALVFLCILVVWIIFMAKKIYAPIGSKKNYGERKPTSFWFKTFTYSTWLYVLGMVAYGAVSVAVTILIIWVFTLTNGSGYILAVILFFIPLTLLCLWIYFILYQTRTLYKGKTRRSKKK